MTRQGRIIMRYTTSRQKQQGAALIIGLTLLMALTIIGIGTLSTTSLEHRMVNNMADTNNAFNLAETSARMQVLQINTLFPSTGLPDCDEYSITPCFRKGLSPFWWNDANWWKTETSKILGGIKTSESKSQPDHVIENVDQDLYTLRLGHDYKPASGVVYYRVTTRATGLTDSAEVITQQVVRKKLN